MEKTLLAVNSQGVKIVGIEHGIVDYIFIEFPGSNEQYMVELEHHEDYSTFTFSGTIYNLDDFLKF